MISLKPNNTCNLTGHIGDRMARRRKRHVDKMSLMLLIFVGCCSTLISSPLLAQAKESNNNATTSKGENMLSTDHQHGAVLAQGEANDKTNDKNTFKRLKPTDFNDKDGVMLDVDEVEEERSSEVIEMIQPPHTLRHQEHYKQRILMAGKDFQQKQKHAEKQLDENAMADDDHNDDDDADDYGDDEQQERELSVHNRNLRYQQIQLALREPLASPTPPHHHRRHEHHVSKQRLAKQTAFTWPQQQLQQQQHHLRHQHHQHPESPQQPQLRHVKPEMRKQNLSTTNAKPLHQRYFDRESSYSNPLARIMTTEGPPPHLRHTGSNKYWNTLTYSTNPHNRLYNDEANNKQKENVEEEQEQEEDIKRFSLSLDEHENIDENKDKLTLAETAAKVDDNDNYDVSANGDDDDSNEEDDYSYEDEDDKEINIKKNKYPSLSTITKTNVKRYTNPLRPLYKPSSSPSSSSSYAYRSNHHLRHTPHNIKSTSNDNDNDDDYDDMVNYEDDTAAVAISSSVVESPNDDDKFSDEKWNKIEHEHYRKQLQHQRAMQALRSRRPSNDNTPHTATATLHNNKYSSYTPAAAASLTPSLTYNAAWTKRQTINDDEGDNIYSRSYVPGTVTRKKEEELGSPTAILESRRQYALQQRQNKALASAHHRRIVTEGSCRLPQPRVERIRRDSWKIYTPHCTILHRCADDAGCCPSERQTCAPKRTKNVDLYFFVISLNETQGSIEKLTFVNHTECHCVQRSKQRAPEYASSGAKDLIANNQIPFLRRATVLNCHCPNLFEKILQEDGYCRCDCSSGNMGCDWLKRGMEHFSMNDRKCIIEGRCKLPTCEYGQYIKKHGRCPRREERHLSADMDW
ncbi:homeobox protein 13 [Calliphora vicina]|uniref:homeobox protein 13 n=1 Tax=Calliphora vicina TaxID=7373 RepID=UPI00325B853F